MTVIENDIIPFHGFVAINLFGVVFARREHWSGKTELQRGIILYHEAIHTAQMAELGFLGFYVLYLFEWVYRLVFHTKTAYRGISFEMEARDHERDYGYLLNRKSYAQWRRR